MRAKLRSGNRVTLPKAVLDAIGRCEYFELSVEANRIVLCPVRIADADVVRRKLRDRGLRERDIGRAVAWARKRK